MHAHGVPLPALTLTGSSLSNHFRTVPCGNLRVWLWQIKTSRGENVPHFWQLIGEPSRNQDVCISSISTACHVWRLLPWVIMKPAASIPVHLKDQPQIGIFLVSSEGSKTAGSQWSKPSLLVAIHIRPGTTLLGNYTSYNDSGKTKKVSIGVPEHEKSIWYEASEARFSYGFWSLVMTVLIFSTLSLHVILNKTCPRKTNGDFALLDHLKCSPWELLKVIVHQVLKVYSSDSLGFRMVLNIWWPIQLGP